ncbi:hypothetical protein [Agrobacterium tumefaciens]|uniref:Uncharacterized protein n=1 Tax=Agrobacterium tumefaciens TaxID=358 RepID=A0A176WW72_AGRTU|nr:hypothetical protein [Agrobacterium tumefaciens]OAE37653.1 hypothetical protein A7J57_08730 [Agrobacterium tumefaciens]
MDARRAYDLGEAIKSLTDPKFKPVKKAIQIALATESTHLDLQEVQSSIEGLISLAQKQTKPMVAQMGRALLTHAVVIYARASQNQDRRNKIGIEGGYSPEQRETHALVLKLRDKSIAHFGHGRADWHEEKFLYLDYGKKAALTFAHKRMNVDYWIVFAMKDLLNDALPYVEELKRKAADRVDEEIGKLSAKDSALLLSSRFDTKSFFGAEEERFWESDAFTSDKSVVEL